jgi:hypothetical protein
MDHKWDWTRLVKSGLTQGIARMVKVLPEGASAVTEIQFFGLYSLSDQPNPYRMGSLIRDGQTHVRGI